MKRQKDGKSRAGPERIVGEMGGGGPIGLRKCLPVIGFASNVVQLSRRFPEKRNSGNFSLGVY